MIEVCSETDIPEGQSYEATLACGTVIFVVRHRGRFYGYVNNCPHNDWPLNFSPNQFFNLDKTLIQCSNHMALFEPKSGVCVSGPCAGDQLKQVKLERSKGKIFVAG